jgi:hypothetical protein
MRILFRIIVLSLFCQLLPALDDHRALDCEAIRTIAVAELEAMRLPVSTEFCLTLPSGETPKRELTSFLWNKGLRPSKAHTCYRSTQVYRISIISFDEKDKAVTVSVRSGDQRIREGEHVGTLYRSGTYELEKSTEKEWKIVRYSSNLKGG